MNKFEKNACIYCRVSTTKQAQEGESLEAQEKLCRGIAERKNARVVPENIIWAEPFSGSKESRPIFDQMMNFIKNSQIPIHYLIFRDIDRLTRGGASSYQNIKSQLAKYGVELVDGTGLIQSNVNSLEHTGFSYPWSIYSPSGLAETFKAESAHDERRTILTRLMGAQIELTRNGYQIANANDGFINKRVYVDGKKKTIQVPNPERAHYYIEMFQMRASGKFSDPEIVDKMNATGFKTRESNHWNKSHTEIIGKRGGKPLTIKQLQRVIQKPIYCGIMCKKWTNNKPVLAQFDGLVDIETFNKANKGKVFIIKEESGKVEMLFDYYPTKVIQKRSKDNPLFPYKETVLCPHCRKPFLGSVSAGKSKKGFPFYHCSRGHKHIGINKKTFEGNFEDVIRGLNFNKDTLQALKIALGDVYKDRGEQIAEFETKVENNIAKLKQRQTEAFEAFKKTSSIVIQKKLESEIEELESEIFKAKHQKPIDRINEYDIENFFSIR